MTDGELIAALRDKAAVDGPGGLANLLNEAAERLEELSRDWENGNRLTPMTLGELTIVAGTPAQLELRRDGRMMPAEYVYDNDGRVCLNLRHEGRLYLPASGYGKTWRCWPWGTSVTRTDRRREPWR